MFFPAGARAGRRARDIAPDDGRAFAAAGANRSSARGAPRCDDLATWRPGDRDHRTRRSDR